MSAARGLIDPTNERPLHGSPGGSPDGLGSRLATVTVEKSYSCWRPATSQRPVCPLCVHLHYAGEEGYGTSLFWVYLAAAVTTGKPLSEFGVPGSPMRVAGQVVWRGRHQQGLQRRRAQARCRSSGSDGGRRPDQGGGHQAPVQLRDAGLVIIHVATPAKLRQKAPKLSQFVGVSRFFTIMPRQSPRPPRNR